jgi:regulator of cell morphogenesis and NO signaling
MNAITLGSSIGQLVAEQPGRSRVFERLGIDYCCGGRKPLREACERKKLDPEEVLRQIAASDATAPTPERDWLTASLPDLCDHVEQTHHAYLRQALPRLTQLTERVAHAHGAGDPRLITLRDVFATFRFDLEAHMMKEEAILFPLCRELQDATERPKFHCGSVENPVRVMIDEHDDAGEGLAAMRELTDGFTPPKTACNTYRTTLHALAELEADMHRHVHLENHILFPRAVETEQALEARA